MVNQIVIGLYYKRLAYNASISYFKPVIFLFFKKELEYSKSVFFTKWVE